MNERAPEKIWAVKRKIRKGHQRKWRENPFTDFCGNVATPYILASKYDEILEALKVAERLAIPPGQARYFAEIIAKATPADTPPPLEPSAMPVPR